MNIRLETMEEERDRYKLALEKIQEILGKEDLWMDKRTSLGEFLDSELQLLQYLKNDECVETELFRNDRNVAMYLLL